MTNVEEIKEHRRAIARYWERIPEAWVNLERYLEVPSGAEPPPLPFLPVLDPAGDYHRPAPNELVDLATRLQGTVAPTNECGAVGCLLGWCWTYKPYQDWCEERGLVIATKWALNTYLGLSRYHSYYQGRDDASIPQKQEVMERIAEILREDIHIEGGDVLAQHCERIGEATV